jgi:hypothetical protein
MSEISGTEAKKRSRLRWITLGEAIAIAALILSGLGLWHEWNKPEEKPAVEKPRAIPLALRGRVTNEGRIIEISPVETGHALQSLTVGFAGKTIEVGSSGKLSSDDFESLVGRSEAEGAQSATVNITARYVEAGADRTTAGSYRISYRWEGGGIFGGRRLRFEDFSR